MSIIKVNYNNIENGNIETGICTIAVNATVTLPKKPVFFVIANDNNREYRVYDNREGNEVLYSTYSGSTAWSSGSVYPRSNPGITYDNDKTFTIKGLSSTTTGTGWWLAVYSE